MRNNVIRYEFDKRCSVLIAYPYYKTMLMYNSVTDVITYKHFPSWSITLIYYTNMLGGLELDSLT